jgi:hypothetical protein
MYSLAKQYNSDGIAIAGGDNWLSDFGTNDVNKKLEQLAAERLSVKQVNKIVK